MTVELDQETPFIGVVATNRQKKKAAQGTEVEVRALKEGEYGPYALAFVNGNPKPVCLSLSNVDYVGPVSVERQAKLDAELDAEREAWRARTNKPVVVGTDPDRETEKAVAFDWEVHSGLRREACATLVSESHPQGCGNLQPRCGNGAEVDMDCETERAFARRETCSTLGFLNLG